MEKCIDLSLLDGVLEEYADIKGSLINLRLSAEGSDRVDLRENGDRDF